jgi:hypothetical protein
VSSIELHKRILNAQLHTRRIVRSVSPKKLKRKYFVSKSIPFDQIEQQLLIPHRRVRRRTRSGPRHGPRRRVPWYPTPCAGPRTPALPRQCRRGATGRAPRAAHTSSARHHAAHTSSAHRMISRQGPNLRKMVDRMSRGSSAQSLGIAAGFERQRRKEEGSIAGGWRLGSQLPRGPV